MELARQGDGVDLGESINDLAEVRIAIQRPRFAWTVRSAVLLVASRRTAVSNPVKPYPCCH